MKHACPSVRRGTWNILVVLLFVLDRILKWYAVQIPAPYAAGFFSFGYYLNPALFFFPAWGWIPWVAFLVLLTISVWWVWLIIQCQNTRSQATSYLLLAISAIVLGGSSNVFDRFAYEGVIDYVGILGLATINLADIMILAGLLGLLLNSRIGKIN